MVAVREVVQVAVRREPVRADLGGDQIASRSNSVRFFAVSGRPVPSQNRRRFQWTLSASVPCWLVLILQPIRLASRRRDQRQVNAAVALIALVPSLLRCLAPFNPLDDRIPFEQRS